MADPKKNTAPIGGAKTAAQIAFDAFEGDQVFTDRPIVRLDGLGDKALPVIGLLVCEEELNLPKGSIRPGGRTTWDAFAIHLTRPTMAMQGEDIVEVVAGREVFVAVNPKNAFLRGHLGKAEMIEVCLMGNGKIDLGRGKNAMQDWEVKIGKKVTLRTGAFLVGGVGSSKLLKDSGLDATLEQVNGAAATQHAAP
jgi:hypothetical protein